MRCNAGVHRCAVECRGARGGVAWSAVADVVEGAWRRPHPARGHAMRACIGVRCSAVECVVACSGVAWRQLTLRGVPMRDAMRCGRALVCGGVQWRAWRGVAASHPAQGPHVRCGAMRACIGVRWRAVACVVWRPLTLRGVLILDEDAVGDRDRARDVAAHGERRAERRQVAQLRARRAAHQHLHGPRCAAHTSTLGGLCLNGRGLSVASRCAQRAAVARPRRAVLIMPTHRPLQQQRLVRRGDGARRREALEDGVARGVVRLPRRQQREADGARRGGVHACMHGRGVSTCHGGSSARRMEAATPCASVNSAKSTMCTCDTQGGGGYAPRGTWGDKHLERRWRGWDDVHLARARLVEGRAQLRHDLGRLLAVLCE